MISKVNSIPASSELKINFLAQLKLKYPGLAALDLESIVADNLLSPFTVKLPKSILQQAQAFVSAAFLLRSQPKYIEHYAPSLAALEIADPGNKSVMMSYDFHLDKDQQLKLIEINTNAAFMIMAMEMYELHKKAFPVADFSNSEIKSMFEQELQFQGKTAKTNLRVAIIDEVPSQQRLYIEFLVCQQILKSFGWTVEIQDFQAELGTYDLIYNRYNDFFLNGPQSKNLKDLFLSRKVCFSPNPNEYFLLADKERLIEWQKPDFLESMLLDPQIIATIRGHLPGAQILNQGSAEALWAQRKQLFFKPMRAYGSKQSYRGASIARKAFQEMLQDGFIAQEYIPAPEITFETATGPQNFKYDLRFYAYQGRVQTAIARLYQGQVTNLKTPLGGFACIDFE